MHHAKLAKSSRLQRVYQFLRDRRWHSTRDIIEGAHVCAVNSCIDELRENRINRRKIRIHCKRNGNVWLYRMAA